MFIVHSNSYAVSKDYGVIFRDCGDPSPLTKVEETSHPGGGRAALCGGGRQGVCVCVCVRVCERERERVGSGYILYRNSYILFIGIHMLCLNVMRGFGDHSPLTRPLPPHETEE
jgi:hypothetical protein